MRRTPARARHNPEPVPPHNGQRAEVEVARSPHYVLWKTGGVVGQVQIWWVITDYTGRMYGMGFGGGAFRKKKDALAA